MQSLQKSIKIRRMSESTNNLCIGVIFLLVAAVFLASSVWLLIGGEMEGIFVLVFSLIVSVVALGWILPYLQHVVLTETSVQVFLGPVKLQEMRAEDICTILYSTVITSLRRPEEKRELTEVPVLVLSTRSAGYLKMLYRRFADQELQQKTFFDEQERESYILHYAIDTHIGNCGRNLQMPKEEGVWMEYTLERFHKLRELYPHAEDCTD